MALDELLSVSSEAIEGIGDIFLYLQAIGIVLIFFIVFQIIAFIINMKRLKKLKSFENEISTLNVKLDRIQRTVSAVKNSLKK